MQRWIVGSSRLLTTFMRSILDVVWTWRKIEELDDDGYVYRLGDRWRILRWRLKVVRPGRQALWRRLWVTRNRIGNDRWRVRYESMEDRSLVDCLPLHHTKLSTDASIEDGQQLDAGWWTKVDAAFGRRAKRRAERSGDEFAKDIGKIFDCHLGTSMVVWKLFRYPRFHVVRCQKSIRQAAHFYNGSLDIKDQQGSRKTRLTVRPLYSTGHFTLKVFWRFKVQPAYPNLSASGSD